MREAPYRYERPRMMGEIMRDDEHPVWCPHILSGWISVGLALAALIGVTWLMA